MKVTRHSNAIIASFLALVVASPAAGDQDKIPRGTLPGVLKATSIEKMELPSLDAEALVAEDALLESSEIPVRPRISKAISTSVSPESDGTWETLSDGSRLWRVHLTAPGARHLSLEISDFELTKDATFWVYSPDGSNAQGPYSKSDRNRYGSLWTAAVRGQELIAELHLPPRSTGRLTISAVNYGYRSFESLDQLPSSKQGSCNTDAVCRDASPWRDQVRSVALITFNDGINGYACTATLVNNTSEDDTPYLLTAGHCVTNGFEASTVVAYWNYESPTCGSLSGGSLTQNQSGSEFKATWWETSGDFYLDGSDFTLLELDQEPNPTFNVYYSGWDARDYVPDQTVTIHQPRGDEKAISFDLDPPTVTSYLQDAPLAGGLHFRIADWDQGTTEPGSSGSCLFDWSTNLCIGTLSGGFAACFNDLPDWYGRMAAHWTGDGTADTRLSDWLDPAGTGQLFIHGKNAAAASGNETWFIPAVASSPGVGSSNWKSQVSLVNSGPTTRSVSIYYVPQGESWPGTLLSGPFTVQPNQSLYFDDILLKQSPTAGAVFFTVDGSGTTAFSRTINLVEDGATFGQGVPGINLSQSDRVTEFVLPMVHSVPGRYRTNLGFAQASSGNYNVLVSIYSSDGSLLAERNFGLSTGWKQFNNIFQVMGIGDVEAEGAWIRVQLVQNHPVYWTTYATIIDNTTADPTYVLPVAP